MSLIWRRATVLQESEQAGGPKPRRVRPRPSSWRIGPARLRSRCPPSPWRRHWSCTPRSWQLEARRRRHLATLTQRDTLWTRSGSRYTTWPSSFLVDCRDTDTVGCLHLDNDKAGVRSFARGRLEDDIRMSPDPVVGLDVPRGSHQDHEDIASAPVLATRWDIAHLQHPVCEAGMMLDLTFGKLKKATRYRDPKTGPMPNRCCDSTWPGHAEEFHELLLAGEPHASSQTNFMTILQGFPDQELSPVWKS